MITITGSEGLLGKSIVNIFEKKNIKIIKIDKNIGLDVTEKETICFLNRQKPKIIIHCAAHSGALSNTYPVEDTLTNSLGAMRIVNWCKDNTAKLIFPSSSAVYGIQPQKKIKENSLLKPISIYAVNKLSTENFIKILSKKKRFPWVVLRLFPIYGARKKLSSYQGVVNAMLSQIVKSKKIIVHGSLSRKRDLIYSKDAARAFIDISYSKKCLYKTINIGTAIPVTINEIITNIIEVFGYSKNNYDIVVKKDAWSAPMFLTADISLAKKLINFKPKFTLKTGLIDTIKNLNI